MGDSIDPKDVVRALQRGWDLANRGFGWWLSAPAVAYKHPPKHKMPDTVVKHLVKAGWVTEHIPYVTAVCILTDEGRKIE